MRDKVKALVTRARKATAAGIGAAALALYKARGGGISELEAGQAALAGIALWYATWRIPNTTPGLP